MLVDGCLFLDHLEHAAFSEDKDPSGWYSGDNAAGPSFNASSLVGIANSLKAASLQSR